MINNPKAATIQQSITTAAAAAAATDALAGRLGAEARGPASAPPSPAPSLPWPPLLLLLPPSPPPSFFLLSQPPKHSLQPLQALTPTTPSSPNRRVPGPFANAVSVSAAVSSFHLPTAQTTSP
ncbi:hypothetical protein PLESTB_001455800 [Pleodorina starrii]|uniref:Uncharacterized protein n=1 Tax=Pleodorina starrii TaxID=330485 RepID=A0A9W6BVU8_9CHLO|nr:hypothetical protein PLESTB_001455800 [Pleodorina starrii]